MDRSFSVARALATAGIAMCAALMSGCDDEYTTAVRREVWKHESLDQTNAVLLARAKAGSGRDIYIYRHFLIMHVPVEPGEEFSSWQLKTQGDIDALLNCSALAGFERAQREARAGGALPPCPL